MNEPWTWELLLATGWCLRQNISKRKWDTFEIIWIPHRVAISALIATWTTVSSVSASTRVVHQVAPELDRTDFLVAILEVERKTLGGRIGKGATDSLDLNWEIEKQTGNIYWNNRCYFRIGVGIWGWWCCSCKVVLPNPKDYIIHPQA